MPILTLSYNNDVLQTSTIDEDKIIKIGRNDTNDITIDESAVSGIHAEIEFDVNGYYITDLQSKNGTFVDGDLVISRRLKHDNEISIGSYTLLFQYKDDEERPDESDDAITEETMMLDTSIHRSKLAKSLSDIGFEKEKAKSNGEISFLDGRREKLTLEKTTTTIGKDSSCDITVKGFLVAKIVAEINRMEDGFYLKAIGGKAKVNYTVVKSEIKLNDFDVIEIGATMMQFHLQTS